MHATTTPIALRRTGSTVFAAGSDDPAVLFRELRAAVDTNLNRNNDAVRNLEAALQDIQAQVNGGVITGGGSHILPVDPDYTSAFASYFRKGGSEDALKAANAVGDRALVQAAMSAGDNSSGGYLAPVEWDRKLQERQRATSPMRRLATVQSTTVGAFSTLWNSDTWGSGWVGETAVRPLTTSATLAPVNFAAGEIYAQPSVTQRLLDDAAINIDNWLVQSVEREFNRQESIAFLSGDGSNKPAGFLTFATGGSNAASHPGGPLQVTTAAITFDTLSDFLFSLDAPYHQNATWLMSSLSAAFIARLKDGDGRPIWRESVLVGQPATLFGRPVEIDEGMPAPTAGNIAVAFGDFKAGYLINDRVGSRILRDPYTNKPYINFYVTKRVGGGVLDPNAIRLLKVA